MQTKNFHIYDENNQVVQDAYAMLTANIHFCGGSKSLKTVAVTSCEPEAGKTTIAINLAISLARSGRKILLIDTDLRKSGDYKRLGDEMIEGLSSIVKGDIPIEEALCSTNIENFFYLGCGKNEYNPIELICSVKFEEFLEKVKEQFDFVVFDTPALASVIDGALIASKTDAVLLVAEMGVTTLTALNRAKEQLEKASANILGVIINKVKRHDYIKYVQAYNYFNNTSRFEKVKRLKKRKRRVSLTKS